MLEPIPMNLVPYQNEELTVMLPHDWQQAGRVLCIAGSVISGFEGYGVLSLTPNVLILVTPHGIEEIVPLWGVEDVSIIKFDGVIIERTEIVGPVLSPLPYPHGIEVVYSLETRLKMRLRVVIMVANRCHEWAADIRRAARTAQLDRLPKISIDRR
jgi:hypothetical protein